MAKAKRNLPRSSASMRSSKTEMRAAAAQKRRKQNLLLIGGVVVATVLVLALVGFNLRGQQPVAGEEAFSSQGNIHIDFGSVSPIAYNSTPPTSGPHYSNLVAWGVHDEPIQYEHLIHNLEDGGVVVYYQCPDECPEIVSQLRDLLNPYIDAGRHVVLVPNDPEWTVGGSQPLHQEMAAVIALTAWQKLLNLEEVDGEAIRSFIDRYEGVDHHPRS
jgi:hypothetical protein